MSLLEVSGLTKHFGGLAAVQKVSFAIDRGEIVSLIGPNGAGKTTIFNLLSGVYPPDAGEIRLDGDDLVGHRPFEICRRGVGRTFQIMQPFPHMTVLENVITSGLFGRVPRVSMKKVEEEAMELCRWVGLKERIGVYPRNLPVADQKRIEIARALAIKPKLLLLDEVMSGLTPTETAEAVKLVRQLRDRGITIFLIEHVMKVVMGISDRVIVLHHGEKISEGPPQRVAHDQKVIEAYLGEQVENAEGVIVLTLEQIDVYYGNIQALWKVSLGVEGGEIITIVGSNGAGKSTILRSISGLIKPRKGSITFDSRRIDALSPDEIVRRGISMVPEGRELFPRMTVRENLELGAAYIDRAYGQATESLDWVLTLFSVLRERSKQQAGTLSGGEQQMLAIGRALMSRPKLLMLDEPSLGLAPLLVAGVFRTVRQINQEGVTVLLVEQNVRQSLTLAHRAYVLENGRMVMEGEGKKLIADRHVKEAYLGL